MISCQTARLKLNFPDLNLRCTAVLTEDSGSDEDFCVDDDDDDSDYGKPKRRSSKGGRRGKPEKKTPRARIRASGKPHTTSSGELCLIVIHG